MELYHGSKDSKFYPKYGYGSSNNDYGPGLYLTDIFDKACEWAYNNYFSGEGNYVYTIEVNMGELAILDFDDLPFEYWLANNIIYRCNGKINSIWRLQNTLIHYIEYTESFDVLIGNRADDRIINYVELFISNKIDLETLYNIYSINDLGKQYCLKSKRAFDSIIYVSDSYEVPDTYKNLYHSQILEMSKRANDITLNQLFSFNGRYIKDVFK